MIIEANFDEVPDSIKPIPPGEYVFNIVKADVEQVVSNPDRQKIVLEAEIVEGEQAGRKCYEHMGISTPNGLVRVKQLWRACGLSLSDQIDTVDLIGAQFRALVRNGTYTDKDTQEIKENSSISKFMYEAEPAV